MQLSESDIKEIYSLFCSPTLYERNQIYDKNNINYFNNIQLHEIYELSQEKKEYTLDAWRAVIYFLYKQGYKLMRGDEEINLEFIESEFIK